MDLNARKEQFSQAYVQAVASVAGFGWARPSVDDDSVDLTLSAKGAGRTVRSPKLDLQLKCHAESLAAGQTFSFPVKIKNYDDLRDPSVMVPRILVVVLVPDLSADWIAHSEAEMILKHCGYWATLRDMNASPNQTTVTLTINRGNLFSPDGLTQIMERIKAGGFP